MPRTYTQNPLRGKSPLYANSWRGDVETPAHQMNSKRRCLREHLEVCVCVCDKPFQHILLHQAGIPVLIRSDMAGSWTGMETLKYCELAQRSQWGGVWHDTAHPSPRGGVPTSESRYRRNSKHNFSCLSSYGLSVALLKNHTKRHREFTLLSGEGDFSAMAGGGGVGLTTKFTWALLMETRNMASVVSLAGIAHRTPPTSRTGEVKVSVSKRVWFIRSRKTKWYIVIYYLFDPC